MSQSQNGSGGTNQNDSGGNSGADDQKDVSYETHRKLLGEKKKMQEENVDLKKRLDALDAEKKQQQEDEAKRQNDFKKLAELKDQELTALKEKVSIAEKQETERLKLASFLKTIGSPVSDKFWGLIDIDQIIIDPQSKKVDDLSVTKAVEAFKKQYPEILQVKKPGTSNEAANGGSTGSLTYEAWLKLPAKEMKAKWKEVIDADKK